MLFSCIHWHEKCTKIISVPDIALRSSNQYGGDCFVLLNIGNHIHGYQWEELTIYDDAIQLVEEIAHKENQHLLPERQTIFLMGAGYNHRQWVKMSKTKKKHMTIKITHQR